MATRRMFSKEITTSDVFVDMPLSSQLLYFQLGMEADDEGFLGNARMLSRAYGTNNDDLKLLEAKGFVIVFPNGVTVIKDFQVNNKIRKDRQKPTIYIEEKNMLDLDSKGSYQFKIDTSTSCQPNDNQMSAQVRLGKDRLGEVRLGKDSKEILSRSDEQDSAPKKISKHKHGEFKNVLLTDEELEKIKKDYSDWKERIDKLSIYIGSTGKKYKSHYLTILNWARKDNEKGAEQRDTGEYDNLF